MRSLGVGNYSMHAAKLENPSMWSKQLLKDLGYQIDH